MKNNITVAGINGDLYRLSEVATKVDQSEVNSIFKHGKVLDGVYYRVRDGVLVLLCIGRSAVGELEHIVRFLAQKVRDQKKKAVSKVTVLYYGV